MLVVTEVWQRLVGIVPLSGCSHRNRQEQFVKSHKCLTVLPVSLPKVHQPANTSSSCVHVRVGTFVFEGVHTLVASCDRI